MKKREANTSITDKKRGVLTDVEALAEAPAGTDTLVDCPLFKLIVLAIEGTPSLRINKNQFPGGAIPGLEGANK